MWPLTAIVGVARLLSGRRSRIVVSEHGLISAQFADRGFLHRILLRISTAIGYRLADERVGVSAGVANDMARLSTMDPKEIRVIHNPIDISRESPREARSGPAEYWGDSVGARLLTVGRLKKVKNHALLLRAVARLKGVLNFRLVIVGDGECELELRTLVEELGLSEDVRFAGFQSDPAPFYQSADVFVLSSDYEGFGNVIVEALACGTPVVSTNCPSGPSEILNDGEFGTLVPVSDEGALANGILSALKTKTNSAKLKSRAADFSPRIAASKYLELLT